MLHISVLFSTKRHLLQNFIIFCSSNTHFFLNHELNLNTSLAGQWLIGNQQRISLDSIITSTSNTQHQFQRFNH